MSMLPGFFQRRFELYLTRVGQARVRDPSSMGRSTSATVARLVVRRAGFALRPRLGTLSGTLRDIRRTRCLTTSRIMSVTGHIRLLVLAERRHLKLAEFLPGPVQMLVFFLLDIFRGRRQHVAKTSVGSLPGDLAEQFPVGMILRFRKHDVLHRIQLILVAGESGVVHG